MSESAWNRVLQSTLDAMGTSIDSVGPQPLIPSLLQSFQSRGIPGSGEDAERLAWILVHEDPNEPLSLKWGETMRAWDHVDGAEWAGATPRHSQERRKLIHDHLAMPEDWIRACDLKHPPRLAGFAAVPVIGEPSWQRWYLPARREARRFFWSRYEKYLIETKGWHENSVQDLDRDSTAVVERLADPESRDAVGVRGLVVGYVQSGKTANFTAVTAKAVDAGYRLIIILAGTLDVLRNQTQRRLDKELVGREVIEARPNDDGDHDYKSDSEWDDFITYGGLPVELGGCDWQRLTTAKFDYHSLKAGIDVLEFKSRVSGRPYNDPANLHMDSARLLVVKKAPAILKKVIKDLKRLRVALESVPTLVIDDESDLASVNTMGNAALEGEANKRKPTNAAIVELLRLLKRSSYVGYTATPAATVLMDDKDELFPRDFIIPLPKPSRYMGVSEFVDVEAGASRSGYREKSFVRHVEGEDEDECNLPQAIDAFVLSGCVKLYREQIGVTREFKHHTMLVHRSHQISDHEHDRLLVHEFFKPSRFQSASGIKRLAKALQDDFLSVRDTLRAAGREEWVGPYPDEPKLPALLESFFNRLHEERVLVANGDKRNEDRAPDFDMRPVWAILVGGTKLSRGYTVEGLTISYYRRRVASSDTLMQMGRWFGYREGYVDLVRAFIGRERQKDGRILDLHEEFRACCLDEERFRAQLAKYALDSEHPLRPAEVPPLVFSSGGLMPTSPNKMRCSRRAFGNLGGELTERLQSPTRATDIAANWRGFERLIATTSATEVDLSLTVGAEAIETRTVLAKVGNEDALEFFSGLRWSREAAIQDVLDYLSGVEGDPEIDQWLLLIPRLKRGAGDGPNVGGFRTDIQERARAGTDGTRYKALSDPRHVRLAKWLAGAGERGRPNAALAALSAERQGVLVAYPCKAKEEDLPNLAFFLVPPPNHLSWRVAFVTNKSHT